MKRLLSAFALAGAVASFACGGNSTNNPTTPTTPTAVTCSLTQQGLEFNSKDFTVSWKYSFSGVDYATFVNENGGCCNATLRTSLGVVSSVHSATLVSANLAYVTLTAGSCVKSLYVR